MKTTLLRYFLLFALAGPGSSCQPQQKAPPTRRELQALNLKAGQLITCGPATAQFGTVDFPLSCRPETRQSFNLGLKLLHSFEYEEAEKVFARVLDQQPDCGMGYWGVAMSNFHPLWAPPSVAQLQKGARALQLAQTLSQPSPKEKAYLGAIGAFYQDWNTADHHTRCLRFEKAMGELAARYPDDTEATILYALALTAAADPTDSTFARQRKAGAILTALYPGRPDHPGIIHYLIHTYDVPALAQLALPAARRYAAVAPSSAHALHMPSHIFTRLGLWSEGIASNLASVASARCYAEQAGIKGHWDEELHGLDYLEYAYLQQGDNARARGQWEYLQSMTAVEPANFKVAYAFAAIPARYLLENRRWAEAAQLQSHPNFAWEKFPWQRAILHFTRLLGAVHLNRPTDAATDYQQLSRLETQLRQQKETYTASQVHIQLTAARAWMQWQQGHPDTAVALMRQAADQEDHVEKHPVTPGEVLPARELLGDMLLELQRPREALTAYTASLKKHPNRFNGLYGAGRAAELAGDAPTARRYYQQLLAVAISASPRPELVAARRYVQAQQRLALALLPNQALLPGLARGGVAQQVQTGR